MIASSRVGVVIVNFNSATKLEKLLDSLADEEVAETLVWDNGSNPADASAAESVARAASEIGRAHV